MQLIIKGLTVILELFQDEGQRVNAQSVHRTVKTHFIWHDV